MNNPPTPADLALLNDLRDAIARNADLKGFRDQHRTLMTPEQWAGPLRAAVYTSNQHGETSEFWEAFRAGTLDKPCDKAEKMIALGLPPLTCGEEEVADILIRGLDMAEAHGIDAAKAVAAKMAYNATRPALHGGKRA